MGFNYCENQYYPKLASDRLANNVNIYLIKVWGQQAQLLDSQFGLTRVKRNH